MVAYNLIGACDACQGESWIPYSEWSTNCTTNATAGTFPKPVPAGTRVPKWAYNNNLTIEGSWNMTLAQLAGDSPEVTGTASIIPTSTSEATPNTSSSLTSSPHHTSNAGAIAGGVVGGIVGAVLIAGFVLWFAFRRRRARSVPSAYMGEKELPPPQNLAELAPKIYDPSDPTTFPSKEYLSLSNEALGSTSHTQPSDGRYTGLPEI
ncbi:hypothetical protein EI94DRAFT_1743527 [Lactarius quietus]|nr:hypothetical protein EI94DRAFT_1743527 [Lactarius quietus]